MRRIRSQKKALAALNYDMFRPETIMPPAPATIYTKIRQHSGNQPPTSSETFAQTDNVLPEEAELSRMFDRLNWMYFDGRLPKIQVEYSDRMTSAGSYTPEKRLIRIGRRYHRVFPTEIADTLKHEMIHIRHFRHNAAFRAEAQRVGASVKAREHQSLRKPPRYLYVCPDCGREYPRQKRLRMASCGVCTPGKTFDQRYKLRLKRTKTDR
ncbi:MAG: SprT-like domain-containing protein [candidate division Zixibacteria bacterium]|nr:SprT-like domain-containing protein [candidate division Zixibacteria bacterium]